MSPTFQTESQKQVTLAIDDFLSACYSERFQWLDLHQRLFTPSVQIKVLSLPQTLQSLDVRSTQSMFKHDWHSVNFFGGGLSGKSFRSSRRAFSLRVLYLFAIGSGFLPSL